MRESTLQRINYAMILAIFVTLAVHLATHAFLGVSGYEDSLTYDSVVGRYRAFSTVLTLGVLLIAACFHGLYGLRNILLETRWGARRHRLVSTATRLLGVAMVGWGLRTIVLTTWGV